MPQFRDNFHSEEAQEIMGRAPSWVVRWGITVIFVILALIVLGCYIIKYPQTVTAPISITTVNAPPTSRPVTTDCSTAYVSATGRTSVPVSLSLCSRHRPTTTTSGRWKKISPPPIRRKHSPRPTGCPTDMFWATCKPRGRSSPPAASIFRHYLATDLIGTKKRLLAAQIAKNKRYYAQLEAQGKLLDKDLAMGQRTLERDSLLFSQSVISAADYETSVQNYLAKQNSKAGFDATLTSTELSILQTEQQLVELAVQRENEVAEYERTIGQLRQQLLAAIAQWKEQYAVIAPMDGIVSLQGYWSKGAACDRRLRSCQHRPGKGD